MTIDADTEEAGRRLARRLRGARSVCVLTGAGVSAGSGIPTFRGKDGLWKDRRVEQLATPRALLETPELAWEWYHFRRGIVNRAEPNPAHRALVRMEGEVASFTLITQNVDGLHGRAGSLHVIELHGSIHRARCGRCGAVAGLDDEEGVPPCPACGAATRPDVVLFGEGLDQGLVRDAVRTAASCEVFLVIGTSALVYPAASLPLVARESGAFLAVLNVEPTTLDSGADLCVIGPCESILPALVERAWGGEEKLEG